MTASWLAAVVVLTTALVVLVVVGWWGLRSTASAPADDAAREADAACAHCETTRQSDDFAACQFGEAPEVLLCHPAMATSPACYELVTVFGETVGDRAPGRALHSAPMPWEASYAAHRDAAEAGEPVAVDTIRMVFGVLSEHCAVMTPSGRVHCTGPKGVAHATFPDQTTWRKHVGPLFVEALTPVRAGDGS